jgi:sarcosine oxidase subunit gamma
MSAAMAESSAPMRVSPLAGWTDAFAALPRIVSLAEVPFCPQLNLRLRSDGPDGPGARAVAAVLGGPLPTQPNTARRYGPHDVLWLGPDEWLVISEPEPLDTPEAGASPFEVALRAAVAADQTGAGTVTDVSAQRTVLNLSGPAAAEVLAHGTAIDLHPQVAPAGTCVQTLLARTGVTIIVRDDSATRFVLVVRASFADYLARWLVDACTDLS